MASHYGYVGFVNLSMGKRVIEGTLRQRATRH
jgi:hypothetical protein